MTSPDAREAARNVYVVLVGNDAAHGFGTPHAIAEDLGAAKGGVPSYVKWEEPTATRSHWVGYGMGRKAMYSIHAFALTAFAATGSARSPRDADADELREAAQWLVDSSTNRDDGDPTGYVSPRAIVWLRSALKRASVAESDGAQSDA